MRSQERTAGHRVPPGTDTRSLEVKRAAMAEVAVCQSEARFELLLCNLHPVFCFSIVNHHPLRLGGCPIPGWAPTIPGVVTWISLREGLAIPLKLIHCKVESVQTLWEMLSCLV